MIGFLMRLIRRSGTHSELIKSINDERSTLEHRANILHEQEQRANDEINRLEALGVQVRVKARDYDRNFNQQ